MTNDEDNEVAGEIDLSNAILLLDGHRGVYIPKEFIDLVKPEYLIGVSAEDRASLAEGPESEFYWDAWENALNNATVLGANGENFTLHHDMDLWLIPEVGS